MGGPAAFIFLWVTSLPHHANFSTQPLTTQQFTSPRARATREKAKEWAGQKSVFCNLIFKLTFHHIPIFHSSETSPGPAHTQGNGASQGHGYQNNRKPPKVLPTTPMLSWLVSSGFDCTRISRDQLLLADQSFFGCSDFALSLFFLFFCFFFYTLEN